MNSDASGSARTSGTTSPAAHTLKNESELTEAEFLDRQAAEAKAAMARAWQDIAAGLEQGIDPRAWTRDYPWAAMTTAAAAGFVAAVALVPTKEQQALRKLAALERALHPPPPPQPDASDNLSSSTSRPGAFAGLFGQLVKTLGPVLSSAITAAIAARNVPPDTNGHPASHDEPPAETDPDATNA